jgi:glycosyltransferase involved in cell wall biosynthesis
MFSGTPLWAGRWAVGAVGNRLRRVVTEWQPDIVQFEYHVMGQYAAALDGLGIPRVLVQHDPGTAAARAAVRFRGARVWARVDLRAWQQYERRIAAHVECIVVFTARDAAAVIREAGATPIVRIPLSTDVPSRALDPCGADPLVLFIGNFKHYPNVDAAQWLTTRLFPLVQERCRESRLAILGGDAPDWLRSSDAVTVAGRVPTVTPWLERASVVVAPIRLGGGMRVKVLEGLAAGKAMVCTTLATEGIDVDHDRQLLIADSERAFADAVVELLRNPERRARLGLAAREWAVAHAGWESSCRAYERLYATMRGHDCTGRDPEAIRARVRELPMAYVAEQSGAQ